MPEGTAGKSAVREQAERVLADPLFRNSKRYSSLLEYIVDQTLEGRSDELKERSIGIDVFGRSPDYDTSQDPTVRVAAGEVRKRLALYYQEPGRELELRIDVPNGSYVPRFRVPEPSPAPAPTRFTRKRWVRIAGPAALLVAAAGVWGGLRLFPPKGMLEQFWEPVLSAPGPILMCVSSPPRRAGSTPGDLASQLPGSSKGPEPADMRLYQFIYKDGEIARADVSAASILAGFLQPKGRTWAIRGASTTSLADLRASPTVLIGGYNNDWGLRLTGGLRFHLQKAQEPGLRWIEDRQNPTRRDWSLDVSVPYANVTEDYALLSRFVDSVSGRTVIAVTGLTGLGTLAASEMATDEGRMRSALAGLPRDWMHKNVQIVVGVRLVKGSPGSPKVLGAYSW